MSLPDWIDDLFGRADIRVNGGCPWDLQCRDERMFTRITAEGSLALGETYMEGLWDCDALDQFFDRLLTARHNRKIRPTPPLLLSAAKAKLLNMQDKRRSQKVARVHYDIGNAFYEAMLDPYMQYTCAYWKGAADLAAAQAAKLDLICRKMALKPGERILELGCGWGGWADEAQSPRALRHL